MEEKRFISNEERMEIENCQQSPEEEEFDGDINSDMDYDVDDEDDDNALDERTVVRNKLTYMSYLKLEFNYSTISINQVLNYFKYSSILTILDDAWTS